MMQSVMQFLSGDLLMGQSPSQDFEFKLLRHIAGKISGDAVNDIQSEWIHLRSRKPDAAKRMHSKFFGFGDLRQLLQAVTCVVDMRRNLEC